MTPLRRKQPPEFVESLRILDLHWREEGAPLMTLYSRHGFTHVLYTSNSFITWDARSIHAAYAFAGNPHCLVSAHRDIDSPDPRTTQQRTHRLIYRYPHFGSFLGEIPWVQKNLRRLRHGDIGKKEYRLDSNCEVFQNMGADGGDDLTWDSKEGYFCNKVTKSQPCVLSFTEGTEEMPRLFETWRRQRLKMEVRMALRRSSPHRGGIL